MNNTKKTGLCCLSLTLLVAPIIGLLVFMAQIYGWQHVAEATGFVVLVILAVVSMAAGGLVAINLIDGLDQ